MDLDQARQLVNDLLVAYSRDTALGTIVGEVADDIRTGNPHLVRGRGKAQAIRPDDFEPKEASDRRIRSEPFNSFEALAAFGKALERELVHPAEILEYLAEFHVGDTVLGESIILSAPPISITDELGALGVPDEEAFALSQEPEEVVRLVDPTARVALDSLRGILRQLAEVDG